MPRPVRPWFRLYTEALHDPKLRRMPPAHRWVWVAVLAAARQSHEPGVLMVSDTQPMDEHDLADLAAVPHREVCKALTSMQAAGMVARADDGTYSVPAWGARQFETDDTTARTRRHRSTHIGTPLERSNGTGRNVPTTFPGTPPETETDTDTSSSSSRNSRGPVDNSVPSETWDAYAELRLRRQGDVSNPVPWKRSTAANARSELGDLAALWWREFDLTPRRLAECLMDGQVRNAQRRVT